MTKKNHKKLFTLHTVSLLLCFFLACATWTAHAQAPKPAATATSAPAAAVGIPHAAVTLNGREIFTLSGETADDALRRAETVEKRMQRLIARDEAVEPFSPGDVIGEEGRPLITLGGEPVLTITEADVANTLIPPQELALTWGNLLSRAVQSGRISRINPLSNALVVIATSSYDLVRSVISWIPRLMGALLLTLVVWPVAKGVRWVARKVTRNKRFDPNLAQLAIAVAFYGTWSMGFLAILSALGINGSSIAAAVGASGFVLGFAFKDVLSHFFAGLMLLAGRQFAIGGQIVVGEFEGTVESIDLRALRLRTFDNRVVTIPNGEVFNSPITTNTYNLYRRREFIIGIDYEADERQALKLAETAMKGVDGVLEEPAPQAVVSQLGASAVDLKMYFYTSSTNTDANVVKSECIMRTKAAFTEAGIAIPFATHTVDVRHVGDLAEALKPVLNEGEDARKNAGPTLSKNGTGS